MNKWFENALIGYSIEIIGITKFSEKTYLIKGKEQKVMLRIISPEQADVIEEIAALHLPFLEEFVCNNRNKVVTCYANEYFFLTKYHSTRNFSPTYSIKQVACCMSELHRITMKYRHIEPSYYQKWCVAFEEHLQEYQRKDLQLFHELLKVQYPTPTLWSYSLSEVCGRQYSDHFERAIKLFKITCINKPSQRIVLNYLHFENYCFDLYNNKLIGCHKMHYDSPVLDLAAFVGTNYDEMTMSCIKEYTHGFPLEEEERIFLICMLYYSITYSFDNDEYGNICNLIEVSRRIEFIFALEDILGIDFSKLNC